MDIQDALKIADDLVFNQTGEHLSDLQKQILNKAWNDQQYSKIADDYGCTKDHAKDEGAELFKILSQALGKEVSKKNFRQTFERTNFCNFSVLNKNCVHIGNINFCGDTPNQSQSPQPTSQEETAKESKYTKVKLLQNLHAMPSLGSFYGRAQELETLKKWILYDKCRLLAILGIIGIGKTSLAIKFVQEIKSEFQYVLWHSCLYSGDLAKLAENLLNLIAPSTDITLPFNSNQLIDLLIKLLQNYHCLLIIDDVQYLNISGELVGKYQPQDANYSLFFQLAGELNHLSSVILISREKPKEIGVSENNNQYIKSLIVPTLGENATEICQAKNLLEPELWPTLIIRYQAHPLWLNTVTTMIQDLLGGSVTEALDDNHLFWGDLELKLRDNFDRLSPLEQKVIIYLSSLNIPVSLAKIQEHLQLSRTKLLEIMQSLERRFMIEKTLEGNSILFTLHPLWRAYTANCN